MAKYVYPATFAVEKDGSYSITFSDLESCYTCGRTLEKGLEMAEDVLALVLYGYETEGREIPEPSTIGSIPLKENEFINFICADTMMYRKMYSNRSVKKTLTLPEWLNEEATAKGINFSSVLQDALKQQLGLS